MPSLQPKAVLIKTSLVDYPHRVAAACFLSGCNLRCPYCYNTELVEPGDEDLTQSKGAAQFASFEEIVAHLKKRSGVLTGFVISGGEPFCNEESAKDLIKEARALGYKIKLDTNGLFPDRLQKLVDDKDFRPDYIALDVKTSPERYNELFLDKESLQAQKAAEKILQSIKIISGFPNDSREFRTVLYPPLVGKKEVSKIAGLLPADANWFFARFLNGHCLSAAAEKIQPYPEAEEEELLKAARASIPGAELR